jgi:hypothetical protein
MAQGPKRQLDLSNASGANAGNYYVTIQNAAGTAMSVNATLTITNAFALLAGVYNGLFYQTNGNLPNIAVQTAGLLGNCVVGPSGAYSAKLYLGGSNYPVAGAFSLSGDNSQVISRASQGLSNLNVTLHLDMTGATEAITGLVSNMSPANPWTAPLLADLAANPAPVPAGTFHMLVPPIPGALGLLTGTGNIVITSTATGIVTLSGTLDDLTSVSQTVPVSQDGTIPLYFSLYGGLGLTEGWVNLATNGNASGTITWIRPPGIVQGLLFPLGFTNVLSVAP